MKTKAYLLSTLITLSTGSQADDRLVVIAHSDSGIKHLQRNDLINLYLGRTKKLPSGITAVPIDAPSDSEQKKVFYEQLVHKSLPEIQAYWARLLFTGQATPPQQIDNTEETLKMVSLNQGAIAYIDRSQVNASVIVVYDFKANTQ
jgi:ABC-type phosphate transport system substrate-binding protein